MSSAGDDNDADAVGEDGGDGCFVALVVVVVVVVVTGMLYIVKESQETRTGVAETGQ